METKQKEEAMTDDYKAGFAAALAAAAQWVREEQWGDVDFKDDKIAKAIESLTPADVHGQKEK